MKFQIVHDNGAVTTGTLEQLEEIKERLDVQEDARKINILNAWWGSREHFSRTKYKFEQVQYLPTPYLANIASQDFRNYERIYKNGKSLYESLSEDEETRAVLLELLVRIEAEQGFGFEE